jgi:hypothetical protein
VRRSKERFPFLNAQVFLSAENVINKLEGPGRINVSTISTSTLIDAPARQFDHII